MKDNRKNIMSPIETYIKNLTEIRSSGAAVAETSYYIPFANLMNEIGKTLKPKVRCIINLKNRGAGIPDGGLFTHDQFQRASNAEPLAGQIPSRGVIEIKSTSEEITAIADSKQVTKYWKAYGQVLVTNYRDFVLIGKDDLGYPVKLETFRLAENEADFWQQAIHPRKMAAEKGEQFIEYLKRVMLYVALISSPEDVAWFLASYARDARARVAQAELPALDSVRLALEEALGIKFEGDKGEHFFRSTLVQTLFYGVFAAWVLWSKQPKREDEQFRWQLAAWSLRVPMIKALFEQIATPSKLGSLGLVEVLDWTATVLNRVDRAAFFAKFVEDHAVQYFYEPFLKAFDPELRKALGVWYTPPEIVKYMVARVDRVLREELKVADGLADNQVYVLDPCCGTGAYLVEVLHKIAETLRAKGGDVLLGDDLKEAAMKRVFGFEILPAPFVIAHLQLGLFLQSLGAPFSESKNERAGVYLTNALTGWEPPKEPKTRLLFPEMEAERAAAEEVKRDRPILVILGNPPYNAFAGVSPKEEQGLVEPYKEGLISKWGIKKFNLDDLYIRFFRLAERRIAEMTGKGVVSFISNHSWISDPSFVVLREHLLNNFDKFWIENMHGDRKISEYAPDGRTSETIFAIPGFSPGIQQGVAISLSVKNNKKDKIAQVLFRDDLNAAKAMVRRQDLLDSLNVEDFNDKYQIANPIENNRFNFKPIKISKNYLLWPNLVDLCIIKSDGLFEKRGGALIDLERTELEKRIKMYYDPDIDWNDLSKLGTGLTKDAARFDAKKCRKKILSNESFDAKRVCRYSIRPFDNRWCYYSPTRPLWNEPRPILWDSYFQGNLFIISRMKSGKATNDSPIYFSTNLIDGQVISVNPSAIPTLLTTASLKKSAKHENQFSLFSDKANDIQIANLSKKARNYLENLIITNPDESKEVAAYIWMHTLSIGYSPGYLSENTDGIRSDWPRIPLPNSKDALIASAKLGREIASLLDTENEVKNVTIGTIRPELQTIAVISRLGGGSLNIDAGELALTAGWGHGGKDGITMPGKGKIVERAYTKEEKAAIEQGAKLLGLTEKQAFQHLGEYSCDIYLNQVAYWKNIPIKVWKYTIGGYQVIKKWLSYREQSLLGRPLKKEEVREVMNMARRIAAIVLLEPGLNENYQRVKKDIYPWLSHNKNQ